MSWIMLDAVLRMSPDLWGEHEIDRLQRYGRYIQAADRIKDLEDVLKIIIQAHEMSCVDWPAMRRAKELLET